MQRCCLCQTLHRQLTLCDLITQTNTQQGPLSACGAVLVLVKKNAGSNLFVDVSVVQCLVL